DDAVHKGRRHIREARALLRLVRDSLGERTYRRDNDDLRAASRPLSQVRDAKALVDALASLEKHFSRDIKPSTLAPVMTALRQHRDKTRRRVVVKGRALTKSARRIEKVSANIKRWKLKNGGWSAIGPGLRVTYDNALSAMNLSKRKPTDENLHEWR